MNYPAAIKALPSLADIGELDEFYSHMEPETPGTCWAWKITYRRFKSGRIYLGEAFYENFSEALQTCLTAMKRDDPKTAKTFGKLIAYPELVRTSIICVEQSEAGRVA